MLLVAADAVGAGWMGETRAAMAGFLVGLLATFLFVRINTRLIRAKVSWWFHDIESEGGTHVHHMVIGVILMVTVGITLIALAPDELLAQVLALLFGVGVALTLDEFALILNLQDVYWRKEGRLSVDAVIIVVCVAALFVLGLNPIGDLGDPGLSGDVFRVALAYWFVVVIVPVVFCLFKGKVWTGVIGLFVPLVALVGAFRLGTAQVAVGTATLQGQAEEAGPRAAARGTPGRALDRLEGRVLRPHRRQAAPAVAAAAGGERTAGRGGGLCSGGSRGDGSRRGDDERRGRRCGRCGPSRGRVDRAGRPAGQPARTASRFPAPLRWLSAPGHSDRGYPSSIRIRPDPRRGRLPACRRLSENTGVRTGHVAAPAAGQEPAAGQRPAAATTARSSRNRRCAGTMASRAAASVEPGGAVDLGELRRLPERGGHSIVNVLLAMAAASQSCSTAQAKMSLWPCALTPPSGR